MLQSKIHNSNSKILFSSLLPFVFSVVFLIASICHAQTEIEGEVSGVWTAEDSPYIVTDSTWVPEDSTLTIEAGVTVRFEEGVGLDVFGELKVNGTEEDTVYFDSDSDTSLWKGLYFWKDSSTQEIDYLKSSNSIEALTLDRRIHLILNNCVISAEDYAITPVRRNQSTLNTIELSHCSLISSGGISFSMSIFHAEDCFIETGQGLYFTFSTVELLDCKVIGGSDGTETSYSYNNCEFRSADHHITHITVSLGGRAQLTDCYVEGEVDVNPTEDFRIADCHITSRLRIRLASGVIENSVIEEGEDIHRIDSKELSILNCEFEGDISFRIEESEIHFAFNEIFGDLRISGSHRYENSVELNHNLIIGRITYVDDLSEFLCYNNTVIMPDNDNQAMSFYNGKEDYDYQLFNNIFIALEEESELINFHQNMEDEFPIFRFNDIWQFDHILSFANRHREVDFEIDSTNISDDPLLSSLNPINPNLTWDSPCIDAGDPDSPEDPDSSRVDMGAFWFDHRLSVEPAPSTLNPHHLSLSPPYPNPFNSHLSIDLDASLPVQLSIYDPLGRVVKSGRYHQRHINLSFNDSRLPTGTYLLCIKDGRQNYVQRLTLLR